MVLQLNDDLAKAIDLQGKTSVQVVYPLTGEVFFLINEEQYLRLKQLFDEEPLTSEEKRYQLQQAGKRAGWDDPAMDVYDRCGEHRK